jgi:uncharacterized membrane protein YvbJ
MICPNCGIENPEGSQMCSNCGYKFEFLHAHGDPQNVRFLNFSKLQTKKQRLIVKFLVVLAIIVLILVIINWFKLF